MADVRPEHVRPLIKNLGDAWYADETAIVEAIRERSSFNLIHLDTAMKVDVFIPKLRRFDASEFTSSMLITQARMVSPQRPELRPSVETFSS